MKASIFIRSYDKDFEWLSFCLRSIQKFASGFHEVVVAVPEGQQHHLKHLTAERVMTVHDGQPGYLAQQNDKLHADLHVGSGVDMVLHCDSDCVFTRPVTPQTFMHGDKVRWLMTPWKDCPDAKKAWFHVCAKCVQECPTHDFMRKSTVAVPIWAYAEFREFIQRTHGVTATQYIMSQPNNEFSEYNTLGFFLWLYHRDKIHWHDTAIEGVPDPWEFQSWSWGGMTPELRNKLAIATA